MTISKDTWEQPSYRIEEYHSWEFTPSENIIANGQLGMRVRLHPRIHTTVASTDEE
jgi:hypothetical protein